GLAGTFHPRVLAEFLDVIGIARLDIERSPYWSRRDRVHANSFLHQALRQRFREGVDRALGRRVIYESLLALESGNRAGIDDACALLHPLERRLRHEEVAKKVGAESSLQLIVIDVVD